MRRPVLLLFLLAACSPRGESGRPVAVPAEATAAIDTAGLMRHIRDLSHDSMLGRAPGSLGEDRTVAYLEGRFRALGLAPGNPDGSYVQAVPLVAITADPSMTLTIGGKGAPRRLRYREDFVAWTRHVAPSVEVRDAPLVFVGYGVEAPEFGWDDYKGEDLAGKVLVMLVNDPPLPDSTQFGGKAMTYYGRWTYKYEQGIRQKAAGVLIVHETGPAGYPWAVVRGFGGERFDLAAADSNRRRAPMEGWLHLDQSKALFAAAGQDLDSLKARALSREFRPVPLGLTASVGIRNTIRSVSSRNVVAKLEGSDPALKDEYVVYTAHWDHFGVGEPVAGDSIYNGALDNATGTAGLLALATAFRALPEPPKRSILFLAVTAEEQGLLGSEHYSVSPLHPLEKTLANFNIDGLNVDGPTRDLVIIGMGASELEDYAREAAAEQDRILKPDPEPEKGFYYRSDHFNFAKQGVPAFYADAGTEVVGKPADFAMKQREKYTSEDYHKPSDEIKPEWNLAGAVQDLQLYLAMGYRVAQAERYPEWRPGNEFRATREKALGR
ncbi:MAG TPA: M28 family metallopeptidase [Gemmatimonadales bacterium]|nr:M28 family metallopeptidase [Gemmatimonadales bacterium]